MGVRSMVQFKPELAEYQLLTIGVGQYTIEEEEPIDRVLRAFGASHQQIDISPTRLPHLSLTVTGLAARI